MSPNKDWPRPWRVRRRRGYVYVSIEAANGEKVCETGASPEGINTLRRLVELANQHPNATAEQLIQAEMRALLNDS